jgi:hypothetical protein
MLAAKIRELGAQPYLFLTWGRREGIRKTISKIS